MIGRLEKRIVSSRFTSSRNAVGLSLVAALILSSIKTSAAATLEPAPAVQLSRDYLATHDAAKRKQIAAKLAPFDSDVDSVVKKLSRQTYGPVKPGYHPEDHFARVDLRAKHPDDLLYFDVPPTYTPDHPSGLIVFLHGGGNMTTRTAPGATLRFPDKDPQPESKPCGDLFTATGMITVGPSALWHTDTSERWCVPETDDYLTDVILECKTRFNIDADRVFLVGQSMGGFGAYHEIQRETDRYAAVVACSGSWSLAYWPVIRGTPLCIIQGVHDARPGVRWHYTDIDYGRWTDKLLTQYQLDHVYMEHNGSHSIWYGRDKIKSFFAADATRRRDPYYPHVAVASPVGFRESYCYPDKHNWWLTLNEAVDGKIEYDELHAKNTDDFSSWHLEHQKEKRRGAAIDAINRGNNTIEVTTKNVARFTLWLHPKMVDCSKPVTIIVDGKQRFSDRVKPSLAVALDSYERRQDWGLIYPIKVSLKVDRP